MTQPEFQYDYDLERLEKITPNLRSFPMWITPRYRHNYLSEDYEPLSSDLLINFMPDNARFIDIGAHYGYYSLLVGKAKPRVQITAIEPVPENREILKRNLQLNALDHAAVHPFAMSDQQGSAQFNIVEASDSSGFYEHPNADTARKIEVPTQALDNLFPAEPGTPLVIKIDTEGHELHVLHGMRKLLDASEDIMLCVEFNPDCLEQAGCRPEEVLQEIETRGFDIFFVDEDHRVFYKLPAGQPETWRTFFSPDRIPRTYANIFCLRRGKALNLCFLSHSSALGGAEQCLLELVREMIQDQRNLCTVMLPEPGPLREKLQALGAATQIVEYKWWCSLESPDSFLPQTDLGQGFTALVTGLMDAWETSRPDIICTNTLVIPWGGLGALLLGIPHCWYIHEFGESDHNLKFYYPFPEMLALVRKWSDLIVTNSQAVRHELFGIQTDPKILQLYNYIPAAQSTPPAGAGSFRDPKAFKLIILGNVTENKGQQDAVLAIKELIRRQRRVELLVMGASGNGQYLEQLKSLVREAALEPQVQFAGFVEDVHPHIQAADALLVCSRHEAFGRVTSEAMLHKKPVIGTNTGGTAELIEASRAGLLYTFGDHGQLANHIEQLMDHPDQAQEKGEAGFAFAQETFTPENYGGKFNSALREILKSFQPKAGKEARDMLDLLIGKTGLASLALRHQNDLTVKQADAIKEKNQRLETLEQAEERLGQVQAALLEKDQAIDSIIHSRAWKWVLRYYRIRDWFFPHTTRTQVLPNKEIPDVKNNRKKPS